MPADATAAPSRLPPLLALASRVRSAGVLAHALALALFGVALGARFAINPWLDAGFPFLTFFPAIVLATFFCGRGPGSVCGALSVLSAWYWFIPPFGSFSLHGSGGLAVGFFVLICIVDILVIDLLIVALNRQQQLQAQSDMLLAQRTVLFQELQHRVANNLMLMGAVLGEQERRLSDIPQARDAVADARRRFDMLSRLHRQLHDPERLDAPIDQLLPGLCSDLLSGLGRSGLSLRMEVQSVPLAIEAKMNLCLLVMELLTNAAKHAFQDRTEGGLWVSLARDGDGLVLRVEDDGHGKSPPTLPGDLDGRAAAAARTALGAHGLGTRIAQGLARALRGELSIGERPGGGTSVQLRFRPPAAPGAA